MLEYKKIPFKLWDSMYLDDFDFNVGTFDIPLEETAMWYYCGCCHNQFTTYKPISLCQNCNKSISIPKWGDLRN